MSFRILDAAAIIGWALDPERAELFSTYVGLLCVGEGRGERVRAVAGGTAKFVWARLLCIHFSMVRIRAIPWTLVYASLEKVNDRVALLSERLGSGAGGEVRPAMPLRRPCSCLCRSPLLRVRRRVRLLFSAVVVDVARPLGGPAGGRARREAQCDSADI